MSPIFISPANVETFHCARGCSASCERRSHSPGLAWKIQVQLVATRTFYRAGRRRRFSPDAVCGKGEGPPARSCVAMLVSLLPRSSSERRATDAGRSTA